MLEKNFQDIYKLTVTRTYNGNRATF